MTPAYNPTAWYWRSDNGRIYSSAAKAVVPKTDDTYVAWTDAGGIPTVWPRDDAGSQTQAALDEVLAGSGLGEPVPAVITYKADIYRRATDEEAEAIEVALAEAPVRQRRLFESAQFLDHTAPEFVTMHEAMVGMFGAGRADELLAAS